MRKMFAAMTGALVGLTVLLGIPTAALAVGPRHVYVGAAQVLSGTDSVGQISADIYVGAPYIDTANTNFTLAEITLRDTTTNTAVEVGWAVNPVTFGDSKPRLFSCIWGGGAIMAGCWNGAGAGSYWTDSSTNTINLGADLSGVAASCNGVNLNCVKNFQIKRVTGIGACSFVANGWQIDYDGVKVGCWRGNAWSGTNASWTNMSSANQILAFGEVDYTGAGEPKADIGNGQYGTGTLGPTGPAYMANLTLGQKSPSTLTENFAWDVSGTDTNVYTKQMYGLNGFGFGGPGYKWNGSAWVYPGDIGS